MPAVKGRNDEGCHGRDELLFLDEMVSVDRKKPATAKGRRDAHCDGLLDTMIEGLIGGCAKIDIFNCFDKYCID